MELKNKSNLQKKTILYTWEDFKQKCLDELNNSEDIKKAISLLHKFLKIYKSKSYNFAYDRNKMLNSYKEWKKNSIKFTKYTIFEKK